MALEAIKGEMTLAQLAAKHGVHQTLINSWKRQASENMAKAFSGKAEQAEANREAEIEKLHAKIGQCWWRGIFCAKPPADEFRAEA